jgi:hypothetical protein
VDCSDPAGPVVRFDPSAVGENWEWPNSWAREVDSFERWLRFWLRGDGLVQLAARRNDV